MELEGRGIIVTGASRGLGRALAEQLADRGARLALVARDRGALEEVAAALRARGATVHALPYDLGDKRAIHPLAGASQALLGSVDVVIHNASTLGQVPMRPLADSPCEALEHALAVNVVGPFRLTKAILGSMVARGEGLVLGISSDAATGAYPSWGPYGASKAALDLLLATWRAELEGTGVAVGSVDPGEMDTAMHRDAVPDADPAELRDPRQSAAQIVRWIEQGRFSRQFRLAVAEHDHATGGSGADGSSGEMRHAG